jgi:RNA polymerase sigma-54 factor
MKLGLQLKLKQTLAPQLIQSLKMLQVPLLRLEQMLRQELSLNPLLEEIDTIEETKEDLEDYPEVKPEPDEPQVVDPQLEKIDWENYLGEDNEFQFKFPQEKQDEERYERNPVLEKSLYEHLSEQLNFSKITDKEHLIGEYILGNIDESGYLTSSEEDIVQALNSESFPVQLEEVKKVLKLIQTFDPVGVGARDLKESLLIQLREKKLENSLAYAIVEKFLSELDKKSHSQIAKSLGITFEEAQNALEVIKGLNPKPAFGRFSTSAMPIVPDLIVDKIGDEFVVMHNDKNIPHLRVNPYYRAMVKKESTASSETKIYIKQKLEQARWFLNAINQRRSTMINVMEAILEEQRDFFENGEEHLKPLTMEEIANKVGINVATVSRVANDKYVQTPQGVFELKYFFNTGVQKEDGGELSKRNVKTKIEEIIKKENPALPLSDQEIFALLKKEGISLARRTVTKYREELRILPARFRKRAKTEKEEKPLEENSFLPGEAS